jgi:hypothetical protein
MKQMWMFLAKVAVMLGSWTVCLTASRATPKLLGQGPK